MKCVLVVPLDCVKFVWFGLGFGFLVGVLLMGLRMFWDGFAFEGWWLTYDFDFVGCGVFG